MVIQPSMLPVVRLSDSLPLEKKKSESRFDALSLDGKLVNPNQILRDPRALSMNERVCPHSWIARMAHPTRSLKNGLNLFPAPNCVPPPSTAGPPGPFIHLLLPIILERPLRILLEQTGRSTAEGGKGF